MIDKETRLDIYAKGTRVQDDYAFYTKIVDAVKEGYVLPAWEDITRQDCPLRNSPKGTRVVMYKPLKGKEASGETSSEEVVEEAVVTKTPLRSRKKSTAAPAEG